MTTPEERAQWAKDAEHDVTMGTHHDEAYRRILALCKDVEDLTAKVAHWKRVAERTRERWETFAREQMKRADKAEGEVERQKGYYKEARKRATECDYERRQFRKRAVNAEAERDYHHARADVLKGDGSYWAEWHRTHCAAAQAATAAEARADKAEQERDEARDLLADYEDVYDRNRDLLRERDEARQERDRAHATTNHEHELRLTAEAERDEALDNACDATSKLHAQIARAATVEARVAEVEKQIDTAVYDAKVQAGNAARAELERDDARIMREAAEAEVQRLRDERDHWETQARYLHEKATALLAEWEKYDYPTGPTKRGMRVDLRALLDVPQVQDKPEAGEGRG